MGCKQGKVSSVVNSTLAAKTTHDAADMSKKANGMDVLPEPSAPPPTDPRLPLNARQVFKLKKSWKGIKRNMEATGVELFISLFRKNSELKHLFTAFKDLSLDDDSMRLCEEFEKHGTLVMGVLDEAISHIDNVDYVIDLLDKTGRTHAKFAGFTPELFWKFDEAFLTAVKIILEDRYSDQMDEIYRLTIKFLLDHMIYKSEH